LSVHASYSRSKLARRNVDQAARVKGDPIRSYCHC
jgi:hypothetical protein